MRLSQRMARLGTETAFEVLVRARALEAQGRSILHLEIGEPDFDTPAHITDAAVEALRGGATHYGPSAGVPELREAVAEDSTRRRGVRATPEMVVVTPGGKPIMFFVILALVDEGDERNGERQRRRGEQSWSHAASLTRLDHPHPTRRGGRRDTLDSPAPRRRTT